MDRKVHSAATTHSIYSTTYIGSVNSNVPSVSLNLLLIFSVYATWKIIGYHLHFYFTDIDVAYVNIAIAIHFQCILPP